MTSDDYSEITDEQRTEWRNKYVLRHCHAQSVRQNFVDEDDDISFDEYYRMNRAYGVMLTKKGNQFLFNRKYEFIAARKTDKKIGPTILFPKTTYLTDIIEQTYFYSDGFGFGRWDFARARADKLLAHFIEGRKINYAASRYDRDLRDLC